VEYHANGKKHMTELVIVLEDEEGYGCNYSCTSIVLCPVVKLWGMRGNGVPLPFLAGKCCSPSLHNRCGWTRKMAFSRSMTATYNTSNRKTVR